MWDTKNPSRFNIIITDHSIIYVLLAHRNHALHCVTTSTNWENLSLSESKKNRYVMLDTKCASVDIDACKSLYVSNNLGNNAYILELYGWLLT
jgi:hypothetical protein